jgi:hypothetical protein
MERVAEFMLGSRVRQFEVLDRIAEQSTFWSARGPATCCSHCTEPFPLRAARYPIVSDYDPLEGQYIAELGEACSPECALGFLDERRATSRALGFAAQALIDWCKVPLERAVPAMPQRMLAKFGGPLRLPDDLHVFRKNASRAECISEHVFPCVRRDLFVQARQTIAPADDASAPERVSIRRPTTRPDEPAAATPTCRAPRLVQTLLEMLHREENAGGAAPGRDEGPAAAERPAKRRRGGGAGKPAQKVVSAANVQDVSIGTLENRYSIFAPLVGKH